MESNLSFLFFFFSRFSGGCVDSTVQSLQFLLMARSQRDVSKVLAGRRKRICLDSPSSAILVFIHKCSGILANVQCFNYFEPSYYLFYFFQAPCPPTASTSSASSGTSSEPPSSWRSTTATTTRTRMRTRLSCGWARTRSSSPASDPGRATSTGGQTENMENTCPKKNILYVLALNLV